MVLGRKRPAEGKRGRDAGRAGFVTRIGASSQRTAFYACKCWVSDRGRSQVEAARALRAQNEGLHLVSTMPAPRHRLRSHIIALFKRGELASVREAELICDASRQAITKWLKLEGINIEARRLAYIARQRSRAMSEIDSAALIRRPSKAEQRAITEKAVREFNKRRGR